MENIELELRFFEGRPISIEPNLEIHKVSFSEINNKELGYIKYNQIINMLCIDEDQIKPYINVGDTEMDVYSFIVISAYQSLTNKKDEDESTLMDDIILVLQYIFKAEVVFDMEYACFFVGEDGVLSQENFQEFQSIIKKRNCLENIEEDRENPDNEMARRLLEKRRKTREKLEKAKQGDDEGNGLTIVDLISIFAEAERMYIEDVFKYDIFQFNNQFSRMKIFKDYEVNIQALLAGAKSEDIDMQHWLSKIKTN